MKLLAEEVILRPVKTFTHGFYLQPVVNPIIAYTPFLALVVLLGLLAFNGLNKKSTKLIEISIIANLFIILLLVFVSSIYGYKLPGLLFRLQLLMASLSLKFF